MNPKISILAACARGKRWRSRLVPFADDIRRLRADGESYRAIAAWVAERGLVISASAIHEFVRARARRGRGPYALPHPETATMTDTRKPISAMKSQLVEHQVVAVEKPVSVPKTFVFKPKPNRPTGFNAEDLQMNDLLA